MDTIKAKSRPFWREWVMSKLDVNNIIVPVTEIVFIGTSESSQEQH
jgi:hypothetical protein